MTENNRTAILIDVLYAVAIGINVWVLMDQVTGGQLNREARAYASHVADRFRTASKQRRDLRHAEFEVVMQATDIVKEA